jgi:hypothetical protein
MTMGGISQIHNLQDRLFKFYVPLGHRQKWHSAKFSEQIFHFKKTNKDKPSIKTR